MPILTVISTAYNRLLLENPIITQTITMSLFCGAGDLIAQTNGFWTETPPSKNFYDWKRFRRMLLKGIVDGIIWSHWFELADVWSEFLTVWFVSPNSNVYAIVRTVVSLLLEQFIACPLMFGLWDLPIISVMNGSPVTSIPGIVRRKLASLLVANAKLWTVVNIFIYNMPLKSRVLVQSIADLFWESLVSTIANRKDGDEILYPLKVTTKTWAVTRTTKIMFVERSHDRRRPSHTLPCHVVGFP